MRCYTIFRIRKPLQESGVIKADGIKNFFPFLSIREKAKSSKKRKEKKTQTLA